MKFNSLKLDKEYDLSIKNCEIQSKLSEYWDGMYIYSEKKVRKIKRMHFSNEIDLTKYHLVLIE
ncbi:MAG: hypothetical protein PV340_01965 [Wolbachia sp.]|nr:hypothetical protein [Wolbachia sp.]MDD9336806.1 hypothetical protein [Wolbachia sp.]